jgi:type I restriction enzyme, R subunit
VCGNLDYFGLNLPSQEGRVMPPLGERVFQHRAELVHILDEQYPDAAGASGDDPETSVEGLRSATAHRLHEEVQGMNRDNFVVRTRLQAVERFADFQAWDQRMTRETLDTASELAGPPTGYRPPESEDRSQEARRFDLLALQLQLAVLKHDGQEFDRLRKRAAETASLLLDQLSIPAVAEQVWLLEAVAGDEWWTDVTVPMLEQMRRRLRGLVRLIDRKRRNPVYSDFTDKAGELRETELLDAAGGVDHKKFKERIRAYIHGHEDDPAVDKLRHNLPITAAELDHLTEVFVQIGIATPEDLDHATEQAGGLGLFLRTLVGMDPDSVRRSFRDFTEGREFTDYMAHNGTAKVGMLYEPPFSHISRQGPNGLFGGEQTDALVATIDGINANAEPVG